MGRDAPENLPLWAWHSANKEHGKTETEALDSGAPCGGLVEAARRTRPTAIRYAARYLGDGLQGEDILEDVLRSAAVVASRGTIEKPDRYLLRGVVRRIRDLLSRRPQIEYVGSAPDLDALAEARGGSWGNEVERNLLIEEVISLMDEETRDIHFRRARGDRWNTIAADLGISADAAEERFRYGLEKVRSRIFGSARATGSRNANCEDKPPADPSQPNRT